MAMFGNYKTHSNGDLNDDYLPDLNKEHAYNDKGNGEMEEIRIRNSQLKNLVLFFRHLKIESK